MRMADLLTIAKKRVIPLIFMLSFKTGTFQHTLHGPDYTLVSKVDVAIDTSV